VSPAWLPGAESEDGRLIGPERESQNGTGFPNRIKREPIEVVDASVKVDSSEEYEHVKNCVRECFVHLEVAVVALHNLIQQTVAEEDRARLRDGERRSHLSLGGKLGWMAP
jgi:hypothetical protein